MATISSEPKSQLVVHKFLFLFGVNIYIYMHIPYTYAYLYIYIHMHTYVYAHTHIIFFHTMRRTRLSGAVSNNALSRICGLRCPRLWHQTIAGKSISGRSEVCPAKTTQRTVTTMGSNDMVVGEDHLLGSSCQRYYLQTGRWGSIAFGNSPRTGKTLISKPAVLRKYPLVGKIHCTALSSPTHT